VPRCRRTDAYAGAHCSSGGHTSCKGRHRLLNIRAAGSRSISSSSHRLTPHCWSTSTCRGHFSESRTASGPLSTPPVDASNIQARTHCAKPTTRRWRSATRGGSSRPTPGVPRPLERTFYTDHEAFVCIDPQIHRDSDVTSGDHRVAVRSATDVLDALRRRTTRSSWTLADWRRFAEQHLGLTPVSLEQATDAAARSAHDALHAYRMRLRAIMGEGLPPLLNLPGCEDSGRRLIDRLLEPRNYLLLGPTGTAKTFHPHHLALALASSPVEIPIIVDSNKFRDGLFRTLLGSTVLPRQAGGSDRRRATLRPEAGLAARCLERMSRHARRGAATRRPGVRASL
jgi:hypothetical protein